MRTVLLLNTGCLFCLCGLSSPVASAVMAPAWRNAVDAASAENALCVYTSNVVRCEWAGADARISILMPANLAFQFAVIGDSDVTNRVQKVLEDVVEAMLPETRDELVRRGMLAPTLQWMVRSFRPAITNAQDYLRFQSHPAAFAESDFDAMRLKTIAAKLRPNHIPPPVYVELSESSASSPLGKTRPGVDYPDVLPELTHSSPFGAAVIIRAPECKRLFCLSAKTPLTSVKPRRYIWVKSCGATIKEHWTSDAQCTPEKGFAEIVLDTSNMGRRFDVMVFAEYGSGIYSAPAIVSFYNCPLAKRDFEKGRLKAISYLLKSSQLPYDMASAWIPHEWKDDYELDLHGRIIGMERTRPGRFRADVFSAKGEYVVSTFSSGLPRITQKVEYFVSPETGMLDYRTVGDEIVHRISDDTYRRSGE